VVKSCGKTAQRPRYCSKLKQQLCIQNGTRAHYLNYLQRGRVRRGKEAQASHLMGRHLMMGRYLIGRHLMGRHLMI
jgi:hypothetical protein